MLIAIKYEGNYCTFRVIMPHWLLMPFIGIIARQDDCLPSPLKTSTVSFLIMKACPQREQREGIQVISSSLASRLCLKLMVSSTIETYPTNLRHNQGEQYRLYVLGVSWITLTNIPKQNFPCLMLGICLVFFGSRKRHCQLKFENFLFKLHIFIYRCMYIRFLDKQYDVL